MTKPSNHFLTGPTFLREVSTSKNSFCAFTDDAYITFDAVANSVGELVAVDITYRVRDASHVPDGAKPNFPPFSHWIIKDGVPTCVGKSHWQGGLSNGCYSIDHGRMTPELGAMLLLFVERYSRKKNWRGYSWVDEMRSTALVTLCLGIMKFDETRGSNIFAYATQIATNAFRQAPRQEKNVARMRDAFIEIESTQYPQ